MSGIGRKAQHLILVCMILASGLSFAAVSYNNPHAFAADGDPAVTANAVTNITQTSATLNATVTDRGANGIVYRGFDWGTTSSYNSNNRTYDSVPQPYTFDTRFGTSGSTDFHFAGVVTDSSGNIFVYDGPNRRIHKFNPSGTDLVSWAVDNDLGLNAFTSTIDLLAIDANDHVFLAGTNDALAAEYDNDGNFVANHGTYTYGTGNGQLSSISAIDIDSQGNFYVAQFGSRVSIFNAAGQYQSVFGGYGSDPGQLMAPADIAIDSNDNVFVLDNGAYNVNRFGHDGSFSRWGSFGSTDGQFYNPKAIAIDANDHVYVTDMNDGRIQEFLNDGTYVSKFGSSGAGNGQYEAVSSIAIAPNGTFYIGEWGNPYRLQKISSARAHQASWRLGSIAEGKFLAPSAVDIDDDGNIYVVDTWDNRVQKFNGQGVFQMQFGSYGSIFDSTAHGRFHLPQSIAVNSAGEIFVNDQGNRRIQKFDASGNYIKEFGSLGVSDGQLWAPAGMKFDSEDNLYIDDTYHNDRISKFNSNGDFLYNISASSTASLEADDSGNIYVVNSDQYTFYIAGYDNTGSPIGAWNNISNDIDIDTSYGRIVTIPVTGARFIIGAAEFDATGNIFETVRYQNNPVVQKYKHNDQTGPFSTDLTGLTCGTTYHYRAYAAEYLPGTSPTGFTSDQTFQTSACPPGPATAPAVDTFATDVSDITRTASKFGGLFTTGGGTISEYGVQYGTTTSYGSNYAETTMPNPSVIVDGKEYFEQDVIGLTCATTYHYRAYATNEIGTTYGDDLSLTTSDCMSVPTVISGQAFQIEQTSTYGSSSVNSSDPLTDVGIEYGPTTSYGTESSQNIGAPATGTYNFELTALTCGTTYHYRAFADNDSGRGYGQDISFTTAECTYAPTVTTNGYGIVSSTATELYGVISSDGNVDVTAFGIEYGSSTDYGTTLSGTMIDETNFSAVLDPMDCGTTYHFRAFATNDVGTTYGDDYMLYLSCAGTPTVLLGDTDMIAADSARMSAYITAYNGGGNLTSHGFEYGLDTNYGSTIGLTGEYAYDYVAVVGSLECNTTYHFRAYATTENGGTGRSEDGHFTTSGCVPEVTTGSVVSVTDSTATVMGTKITGGGDPINYYGFQYGPDTNYGWSQYGAGSAPDEFQLTIYGLECGTTYHYRTYASNNVGSGYGSDATFETEECAGPPATSDLAFAITLTTTGPITSGDTVNYTLTVSNVGENDITDDGYIYAVLPVEFTFDSAENPNGQCMDMGLGQDLNNPYFESLYTGRHLAMCELENMTLDAGDSLAITVSGTANSNYVSGSTKFKGVVGAEHADPEDAEILQDAIIDGVDFTTINSNARAIHTYSAPAPTTTQPPVTTTEPAGPSTPNETNTTTTTKPRTTSTTAPSVVTTTTAASGEPSGTPTVEGETEVRPGDTTPKPDVEKDTPWLIFGNHSLTGSNVWDMLILAGLILIMGACIHYISRYLKEFR